LSPARARKAAAHRETGKTGQVMLYRCHTPTDWLCPCGAVARRLRKHGVEHRTERVALRRSDRPEIVELTRQERVPVLVDGEEVIHDSKRILQYLDHAHASKQ
jgi:glutathione S-transferase